MSQTRPPAAYLVPAHPRVRCVPLLTVPDAAPDGYRMAGVPDGLGTFFSAPDRLTVVIHHELKKHQGKRRKHASSGAFVSRWTFDTSAWSEGAGTLRLVEGRDQIERVQRWDRRTRSHYLRRDASMDRLCSADLPPVSALSWQGLGIEERLLLGGEERHPGMGGDRFGRAFAHVLTGSDAGTAWELPHLGQMSFENVLACPVSQAKTVLFLPDDATIRTGAELVHREPSSELYVYVGAKGAEGSAVARAGLLDGVLYGAQVHHCEGAVLSESREHAFGVDRWVGEARFALIPMSEAVVDRSGEEPGAVLQRASCRLGVTQFLRPEDACWDPRPGYGNRLWFTTTDNFEGNSRLFELVFDDVTDPVAGGTLRVVASAWQPGGSRLFRQLDSVTVDPWGRVLVQEDPDSSRHRSRALLWDGRDFRKVAVAAAAHFDEPDAPLFITHDEECAGLIPVFEALGEGWYLTTMQCNNTDPWPEHLRPAGISGLAWRGLQQDLVTPGQLLAVYVPRGIETELPKVC